MGRPKNTAARRAEITAGLLEVLAAEGYEGATVAAIARAAGLAPGLVHYHFATKEEVLVALVEELAARLDARARAGLEATGDDPRGRLLAYVDAHVALGEGADARAVAAWVAIGAEATRRPDVRRLYQGAVKLRLSTLEALFRDCLRAEGKSPRSAPAWAAAVASAIEGAYLLATAAPGSLPRGFAAPALRRMVVGLLGEDGLTPPDEPGGRPPRRPPRGSARSRGPG